MIQFLVLLKKKKKKKKKKKEKKRYIYIFLLGGILALNVLHFNTGERRRLSEKLHSLILFNLLINDIYNRCDKYGIFIGDKHCCGDLFEDEIVLYAQTRTQLKKLVKFENKWSRNNEIQFSINKCTSLVV